MRAIHTLFLGLLMLASIPAFAVQSLESREGYFVLEFSDYNASYDSLEVVRLVDGTPDTQSLQQFNVSGQRQATMSGFANGHYLVRLLDSSGSEPPIKLAKVWVQHRSLYQALALFVLGLAAFSMLVGILIGFVRKERDGQYA
ncbi:hypothetical protein KJY73_03510 [Bowmanella sp. Y26]|uniref:hypothetical protein n=1 Tax=Bowmanella yangjiangensis TaxID=2811230 RepID=UPI001BDBFAE5|nr:hypothetical protein [Bowmanella yangjiangensis]MBT1062624.1 hypothetical protein [Bowmanella yangjiangensis]